MNANFLPSFFRFGLALFVLLAFSQEALASRIAVVVKGEGADSEKAATLSAEALEGLISEDSRYELFSLSLALGDPGAVASVQAFAKAAKLHKKAQTAYDSFELDLAIKYLKSALRLYEHNVAYVKSTKEIANALVLLGRIQFTRNEKKIAQKRFLEAFALYSSPVLGSGEISPELQKAFERADRKTTFKATGMISITSNARFARIYLDGKFSGLAPESIKDIPVGRHYLRIEKEGYGPWGSVIHVKPKGKSRFNAYLKQLLKFEKFDATMNTAMRLLNDSERDGQPHQDIFYKVGEILGANKLFLASVKLEGNRAQVIAAQFSTSLGIRKKTARHSFLYSDDIDIFKREMRHFFSTHFESWALDKAGAIDVATSESAQSDEAKMQVEKQADADICFGLSCWILKLLSTTIGLLLLGGGIFLVKEQRKNQR